MGCYQNLDLPRKFKQDIPKATTKAAATT